MVDNSFLQSSVGFAAAGALAVELLKLAEIRNIPKHERPDMKEALYWVPYFILPLVGAGLAYVYIMSEIILRPILAVNIGISAPLIIRAMASSVPKAVGPIDPGHGA